MISRERATEDEKSDAMFVFFFLLPRQAVLVNFRMVESYLILHGDKTVGCQRSFERESHNDNDYIAVEGSDSAV